MKNFYTNTETSHIMKKYTSILLFFLFAVMICRAEGDNLITISANGVRTTYALSSMQKVVIEDKSATEPKFKVMFNDGTQPSGNLRAVAVELETYPGEDEVIIEASNNSAKIIWPVIAEASYYQLTLCKDMECKEILCTLKFNSSGQLIEINFASNEENGSMRSTRPLSFNVTGLEPGTTYAYSIKALGSAEQVLDEQNGVFNTLVTSAFEASDEQIQVYSNSKRIVVDSPTQRNITFYNLAGVQLGECVVTQHCECTVTLSGVYVVRVDDKQYKIRIK